MPSTILNQSPSQTTTPLNQSHAWAGLWHHVETSYIHPKLPYTSSIFLQPVLHCVGLKFQAALHCWHHTCQHWGWDGAMCYNSHKNMKFILNISILLPSTIFFTHNMLILLTPYNQTFIWFWPQTDKPGTYLLIRGQHGHPRPMDPFFSPFLFLLFYFIHLIRTLLSWILHHRQISLNNHMNMILSLLYPITCTPTPRNISPK